MSNGSSHDISVNKVVILELLNQIELPITNSKISDFIVKQNYVDYFNYQSYLSELVEEGLINKETYAHKTLYAISPKGQDVLTLFRDLVPKSSITDIENYIILRKSDIRSDSEITADYYPSGEGEYTVVCRAKEQNYVIFEFKVNVFSKSQAIKYCKRWTDASDDIYISLLKSLNKED